MDKIAPDANVEHIRKMLHERACLGLVKYGVNTERTDLTLRDWLQHALEETLDTAVYLQAAISKLDKQNVNKN